MLQAHPKRIPEAENHQDFPSECIRFLSYRLFFAYALQAPEVALNQELLHLAVRENIRRIAGSMASQKVVEKAS